MDVRCSDLSKYLFGISQGYFNVGDYGRGHAYRKAANSLLANWSHHEVLPLPSEFDYTTLDYIGESVNEYIVTFFANAEWWVSDFDLPGMNSDQIDYCLNVLHVRNYNELISLGRKDDSMVTDDLLNIIGFQRRSYWSEFVNSISDKIGIIVAGSYRRNSKIVHDLDFVYAGTYDELIAKISQYHGIKVIGNGTNRVRVLLTHNGKSIEADIKVTSHHSLPFALLYLTGPVEFNIKMRRIAKSKGLTLNEYGLFKEDIWELDAKNESEIFSKLEMDYVAPEYRK